MCLFVRHHHVRLACIVTVGIWDPDIFDITSFYGKGVVKLSSEAEVRPTLPKIGVHLVFLSNEKQSLPKSAPEVCYSQISELYLYCFEAKLPPPPSAFISYHLHRRDKKMKQRLKKKKK